VCLLRGTDWMFRYVLGHFFGNSRIPIPAQDIGASVWRFLFLRLWRRVVSIYRYRPFGENWFLYPQGKRKWNKKKNPNFIVPLPIYTASLSRKFIISLINLVLSSIPVFLRGQYISVQVVSTRISFQPYILLEPMRHS